MPKPFQLLFIIALAAAAITGCSGAAPPATASAAATPPAATQPAPTPAGPTPVSITLLTESAPAQACMDALAQGTLVPDPRTGLALATSDGQRMPVMWPFGYSARLVDAQIELLDGSGALVAREGDTVQMGGGSGQNGLFFACAEGITVVDG